MRILVIGCGSIGYRHMRLLQQMGIDVGGYDSNPNIRKQLTQNGMTVYANMDDAWDYDPDGVIIATPNHMHVESVEECLLQFKQRGYHTIKALLIEKPLARDVAAAQDLQRALDLDRYLEGLGQVPALVGYCLRFHSGLRRIKTLLENNTIGKVRHAFIHFGSYLPGWRPGTDYRQNYAALREQGGGILLDASHELDYALWLFGRPISVSCTMQNSGALEIETEDIADLIVTFESGAQANIHLDYLRQDYGRGCTIIGDDDTLELNVGPNSWGIAQKQANIYDGQASDRDDMYRAELVHFLQCINGDATPLVTIDDGEAVLRLVEAAKQSAAQGRVIML